MRNAMRRAGLLAVVFVGGCGAAKEGAAPAAPSGGYSAPAEAYAQPGAPSPEAAPGRAPAADKASEAVAPSVAEGAPPPAPPPASATTAPIARSPRTSPQAGQLTAGVWDDNRNFDFYKPYAMRFIEQGGSDFAMFTQNELLAARDQSSQNSTAHTDLDVQLVLDTTGSMGDELAYLQSEFDAIAAKVRVKFPNVTPRWSLVVYRDKGDEYLTRQFEFTTDTGKFRRDLRAQSAGGGGDTPEAVVEGLSVGLRQGWRAQSSNVAKMVFWVADAPAHPGEGKLLANVIRSAKQKGVHVYPIASSDTDDAAEYQMRAAAQLTGGRYIFLTNDSGVGNDHAEPHIPCYNVTRLDNAIVRMIQVELSGRHIEPESNEVIRSVGRPNKEGKCQLASGMLVASY